MKSEYYLATVVNAYRRALDSYFLGTYTDNLENFEKEVRKVVHRDYTVAYALGNNDRTIAYNSGQNGGTHEFIAVVEGYLDGYATVEMRNRFRKGDTLEVLSPSEYCNTQIVVDEMYDDKGNLIDDAKIVQQLVKVKVEVPLQKGDILRRKR